MTALVASFPRGSSRPGPALKPMTLVMRMALGMLHTGALFRQNGRWRSREFPGEQVQETTIQILRESGFVELKNYTTSQGEKRLAAVLTTAGIKAYDGGKHAARRPPPLLAEISLCEVQEQIATFGAEAGQLQSAIDELTRRSASARRLIAEAECEFQKIERHLARLERERDKLETGRIDMRMVADQACQRLGLAIGEGA